MDTKTPIHYATLAPSGHNTQPWKFSINKNTIRLFPDFTRSLPVVDPDNLALFISLGCALENLVIAARQEGLRCRVDYFSEDETEECIRITLQKEDISKEQDLFDAFPERHSNRSLYDERNIAKPDMDQLLLDGESTSVEVMALDAGEQDVEPIISLVKEACEIQFKDRRFVNELTSWIRFSKKEVRRRKDGLTAKVMGFPYIPGRLGRIILKTFARPKPEADKTERQIRSSSHLLMFVCKKNDKKHWVDTGRVFERIALKAASLGISHAHLNMPCEVESVRMKLSKHLQLQPGEQPVLLIRLGYAGDVPRSPRRPIGDVLIQGKVN